MSLAQYFPMFARGKNCIWDVQVDRIERSRYDNCVGFSFSSFLHPPIHLKSRETESGMGKGEICEICAFKLSLPSRSLLCSGSTSAHTAWFGQSLSLVFLNLQQSSTSPYSSFGPSPMVPLRGGKLMNDLTLSGPWARTESRKSGIAASLLC